MAPRKTSQTQHETTPSVLNPFAQLPGAEVWRSMMESQSVRFEKMLGDMERLEKERHQRALGALEDMTALLRSSLDYQQRLADEWRKLGVEAAKKAMGTFEA